MTIGAMGAATTASTFVNTTDQTATTAKTGSGTASSAKGSMASQLSTPDLFIKLLMAELEHENPTNPTTPSSILQQTAELSQVEAITSMTTALDKQRQYAATSDATGLIGKQVTASITGIPISGTVSDVSLTATGTPVLEVAGLRVPLASVTDVSLPATALGTTGTT